MTIEAMESKVEPTPTSIYLSCSVQVKNTPILLLDQRWESSIGLRVDLAATLSEIDVVASRIGNVFLGA